MELRIVHLGMMNYRLSAVSFFAKNKNKLDLATALKWYTEVCVRDSGRYYL